MPNSGGTPSTPAGRHPSSPYEVQVTAAVVRFPGARTILLARGVTPAFFQDSNCRKVVMWTLNGAPDPPPDDIADALAALAPAFELCPVYTAEQAINDVERFTADFVHDHSQSLWQAEARGETPTQVPIEGNADTAWRDPQPLQARGCAFPIEDAFPQSLEPVRDYCRAIGEAFQVPVDMGAMLVPPVVGLTMSHIAVVRLGQEWVQPPNHYNAVLMESGNRKTGPYKVLLEPVYEYEQEHCERLAPEIAAEKARLDVMRRRAERLKDIAAGKVNPRAKEPNASDAEEAAIELEKELALAKPLHEPQYTTTDITSESLAMLLDANGERLGIFSDESEVIDVFLGRYDGLPNVQLYNKAHDGSPHRTNRVNRSPIKLRHPLLSIGFVIQPEAVRDFLTNRKAKGTGLVARFGMSLPTSMLGERAINTPGVPLHLKTMWRNSVRRLMDIRIRAEDGPLEVPLDDEAMDLFCAFCARIEPSLGWCGEFAACGMRDWGGKLCGKIGRTALVLHGLQYGLGEVRALNDPISLETMTAAIAWSPYLIEHAKAVTGWVGQDDATVTAQRTLAWIARHGLTRFTKRDCHSALRGKDVILAQDVDRPLQLLADLGYVRALPAPPKTGPGQPASPEFLVNPQWKREVT